MRAYATYSATDPRNARATGVSNSNNHQRRRRNDFFVDFFVALAGACFGTYPLRLVDGFDPVATVGPMLATPCAKRRNGCDGCVAFERGAQPAAICRAVKASRRWFQQQLRQTSTT